LAIDTLKPSAAPSDAALPRARRLRSPAQFKHVYAQGRRVGNDFFSANSNANGLSSARLGMSVAARLLRRAVDRNRVRRLIRESFRVRRAQLPGLDIVIGVRAAVKAADNAQLRAALEQLWQKIVSTCA